MALRPLPTNNGGMTARRKFPPNDKLRAALGRRNMKVVQFAALCGKSPGWASQLLSGDIQFTQETLGIASRVLQMPPNDLMDNPKEAPSEADEAKRLIDEIADESRAQAIAILKTFPKKKPS